MWNEAEEVGKPSQVSKIIPLLGFRELINDTPIPCPSS